MLLAYVIASIAYVLVSIHLCWALVRHRPIAKGFSLGMLGLGILMHASIIYPQVMTIYGLNFNIFNIISLTSLFFLLFYTLFSLYRPILSLGILAAPTAFIGLSAGYFGRAPYKPLIDLGIGLETHILLSIAAYCVLFMAALQAVFLRLQIRELKHRTIHRLWVEKLPPLESMESLLFDMILVGFILLSLALGMGFVYVHDLMAQHIAHKTVFSVLSWLMFGALLVGHWRAGWRGKRAANITIYAFILLAIGFVGSKFVLELVLKTN
ncbi:MAG: cytochrome c biogenesis protein CcsA [Psychrobacter sp.]|nr:cytochrome c biogenesis protein CcsA [Psychrobacter sp.]